MKWYKVKVTFTDGEIFFDEIQGVSREHALKRAYWNWDVDVKEIEVIE